MLQSIATPLGRFRLLTFAEGVSFLVILFITMPLKYWFDYPEANKVVGMIHGVLFILYVIMVLQRTWVDKWSMGQTLWGLAASVIPFGTFWFDHKYLKPQNS
ncbi:DUF3817 domain-containing protein [Algivirga pacifica]|uniref:DUF3817 domain-containing protein n=1 Tax=Algivirga pacifica TaxID=1162670 RepID=A0ABP9D7X2_9BACT